VVTGRWLVVGLGNPGPTYAKHRHNAGFLVVDELARRGSSRFTAPAKMRADVADVRLAGSVLTLVKPRTFMNDSGVAVGKLAAFYKITPDQVVVVHDELDIDPGRLRVKLGGGDGGHNGLKSIRAHLGTGVFYRVRFGIGRPPGRQDPAAFVLSPFPASFAAELAVDIDRAADAVECLISEGLATVQNRFNS